MASTSQYWQPSLFGRGEPSFDAAFPRLRRIPLDGRVYIEHLPRWLSGDIALFEHLRSRSQWRGGKRWMYEREVAVPRMTAGYDDDNRHPVIDAMSDALSSRYQRPLSAIGLAYYRDGEDSVAWHGDRVEFGAAKASTTPWDAQVVIAIVSLGEPRRFMLRRAGAGAGAGDDDEPRVSLSLNLGWGDLVVMGPGCQSDYEHCVPKQAKAGPRISVQFRQRHE
ncbi:MAG: alpha-ketoglutarate-dependent dioxygenase AlkB [Myxococcales bacterium]|nr:alpha-ketoglutarate-dependent dioxygenase AlkB [Myxococcales bacterium]